MTRVQKLRCLVLAVFKDNSQGQEYMRIIPQQMFAKQVLQLEDVPQNAGCCSCSKGLSGIVTYPKFLKWRHSHTSTNVVVLLLLAGKISRVNIPLTKAPKPKAWPMSPGTRNLCPRKPFAILHCVRVVLFLAMPNHNVFCCMCVLANRK